jgi:hypothetical protein
MRRCVASGAVVALMGLARCRRRGCLLAGPPSLVHPLRRGCACLCARGAAVHRRNVRRVAHLAIVRRIHAAMGLLGPRRVPLALGLSQRPARRRCAEPRARHRLLARQGNARPGPDPPRRDESLRCDGPPPGVPAERRAGSALGWQRERGATAHARPRQEHAQPAGLRRGMGVGGHSRNRGPRVEHGRSVDGLRLVDASHHRRDAFGARRAAARCH